MLGILGADRRKLFSILLSEFLLLGSMAGLIAAISVSGILYWLSHNVFDFPYQLNYSVLVLMPLIGMALLGLGGWAGSRQYS